MNNIGMIIKNKAFNLDKVKYFMFMICTHQLNKDILQNSIIQKTNLKSNKLNKN